MSQAWIPAGAPLDPPGTGARAWLVPAIATVSVIALISVVVTALLFVLAERKQIAELRDRNGERLANIDKQLAILGAGVGQLTAAGEASKPDFPKRFLDLLNQSLRRASENDSPILAMKTATAVTRKARSLGTRIDPGEVATIGQGFLRLVSDERLSPSPNPANLANDRFSFPAIETAGELLGYRSILLRSPLDGQPEGPLANSAMEKLPKLHAFRPLDPASKIYGSMRSMAATGAKIDLFDHPEPVLSEQYRALLVDGYDLRIDGMDVRNVVFTNSRIAYSGGRISLDTVYFSNCTFDIPPEGKDFANVAFSASGAVNLAK